jgi:hypothetical protein
MLVVRILYYRWPGVPLHGIGRSEAAADIHEERIQDNLCKFSKVPRLPTLSLKLPLLSVSLRSVLHVSTFLTVHVSQYRSFALSLQVEEPSPLVLSFHTTIQHSSPSILEKRLEAGRLGPVRT